MKKITITIITLFFATQIFAQNYTDTTLAKQYYELGTKYYNEWNLDSSIIFYQKAADIYKQIAEENNDTLMWEKHVWCLYDLSHNLTSLYDFENSINILDSALAICFNYLGVNHKYVAKIYKGFGMVYYTNSN